MTDIEIARAAKPLAIGEVAQKLGVPPEAVEPYGKYKAKLMIEPGDNPSAKLIGTATHPTLLRVICPWVFRMALPD